MRPFPAQYYGYGQTQLYTAGIPAGAQPPRNPSQRQFTHQPAAFDYSFTPPQETTPMYNGNQYRLGEPSYSPSSSTSLPNLPTRPRSSTSGVVEHRDALVAPNLPMHRSTSQLASLRPPPLPLYPSNENGTSQGSFGLHRSHNDQSTFSFASEEYYAPDDYTETTDDLSRELSNLSITSEEALRRFHAGELSKEDSQWHRLVPFEAREALGQQEVQRQSTIFEIFTYEKEYVTDLEILQDVYIEPLRNASPPIISEDRLKPFITDVFWNIGDILAHHRQLLANLFERQREQHPLIQSVTDVFLRALLEFRDAYESYIKHYPLAEALHRTELKRNPKYLAFIQQCSQEPRVLKRDLLTFLFRPVTRLGRSQLMLAHLRKLTDVEHPDYEEIPMVSDILEEFIKSTQPGVAVSASKVKLRDLSESLVYVKGEMIDLDLYDESRTLVEMGTLARRQRRSESDWYGWNDLTVALLDHYLILTREETRANGVIKRNIVSRPIPLDFIRLGSFDNPPENRRERADDGRLLESLRPVSRQMFPFTVYHASSKTSRHYTLYASSEHVRKKWQEALVDTIGVHRVRCDSNMYYVPHVLSNHFFPVASSRITFSTVDQHVGKVTSGVPFSWEGRSFLAIGCSLGIFVAVRGQENFCKVLDHSNPTYMMALEKFNKFVVHHGSNVLSYSIQVLARVVLGQAQYRTLEATQEKIAGQDGHITLARAGLLGDRTLIIYAQKKLLQVSFYSLEAFNPAGLHLSPTRSRDLAGNDAYRWFRPFGNPFYVPGQAFDVIPLAKSVAVTTGNGLLIVDPTNPRDRPSLVPDWSSASSDSAMARLKSLCEQAKPLGLIRCAGSEFLLIYDTLGCYMNKQGIPTRASAYIHWETKATSYAHCGPHVLLFSPQFIEVRSTSTGRLDQVIEGSDIRLLHCGPLTPKSSLMIAVMAGEQNGRESASEKIVELQQTSLISYGLTPVTSPTEQEPHWEEWDVS